MIMNNGTIRVVKCQNKYMPKATSGTSGHRSHMLMVVFDWQGLTCYLCSIVTLGPAGNTVELLVAKVSRTTHL